MTCLADISAWLTHPLPRIVLTALYVAVLALVALYGMHRYYLVWLFYRHRRNLHRPPGRFADLPRVTVQLPMYNEGNVARRVIDAACHIDYPRDRLQIQVVDDSTDASAAIAQERVAYWRARGMDIAYLHRADRRGFKAGALADAMSRATGEFIAIFDADFIPPPNFLKRTIHHFTDPAVGMVQACWGHLNRNDSVLTRSQAIFLDGHFVIEHTARNRSRRWMNFNGTAGLWRRAAIEAAGGWHSDTLTEDVDLSYRAQLAGWRFVFLPRVTCPAELPPEINAFKAQQHRWTKGSIQVARKLLPRLLRAPVPWRVKVEAFFHLTSPMVYLYITLMTLLFYPAFYVNMQPFERGTMPAVIWGLSLFALGTCSAGVFYVASQRAQRRSVPATLVQIPVLMAIGIGIALNNAVGCIEALLGRPSEFVRTPKYAVGAASGSAGQPKAKIAIIPIPTLRRSVTLLEIALGFYMLMCVHLSLADERTLISAPFLALFAAGYLYVGLTSLWVHARAWWGSWRIQAQTT